MNYFKMTEKIQSFFFKIYLEVWNFIYTFASVNKNNIFTPSSGG